MFKASHRKEEPRSLSSYGKKARFEEAFRLENRGTLRFVKILIIYRAYRLGKKIRIWTKRK